MKIHKKYYFSLTLLGIGVLFSTLAIVKQKAESDSIDKNKYATIAIVDTVITRRTSSNIYYIFFFEGKKIKGSENRHMNNIKSTIGKFYNVHVSEVNPAHSKILLNEEVTDTVIIEEAGFDIRND